MPGPCAKSRVRRGGTPTITRRLRARIADFDAIPNKDQARAAGRQFHKPGSENRKK